MHTVLLTPRLRLRYFAASDATFVLELINEPAWIAGIRDAGVRTEAAARDWLQSRLIDPCWTFGHGFWCVERRSDGEALGMAGVFQRDSLPLPDLGYGFLQRHWGQGYAREAARACVDYAQAVLGRHELLAITAPHNMASGRLLQDLGFVAEGEPQAGSDGPTQHWRWRRDGPVPQDDAAQLDDLVRRFFDSFDNRNGRAPTALALPALFAPDAAILLPDGSEVSVREFIEPRLALLRGPLQAFHEWELSHDTRIEGAQATRRSRYAKEGQLNGAPYASEGDKQFHFMRDAEGRWRIGRLQWQEDGVGQP